MAARNPLLVRDGEVYVVTPKGERELQGAETSLSPAEIELLIRTDGAASVADVKSAARTLAPRDVPAALQGLIAAGLIAPAPPRGAAPDAFTDFFGHGARAAPTAGAVSQARLAAPAGVSSLQKQGYFVRIARRPAARRAPDAAQRPLVLVVEDEPHLAKFLGQYLALDGFDVRLAANRLEIVAALREPPLPALVLLDVMLPDADGFDVLLKMRQHAVMKSVPVIMMTAKATREAVLQGLARGANGYVTKPFEPDVLIEAVRAVLGMPRSK